MHIKDGFTVKNLQGQMTVVAEKGIDNTIVLTETALFLWKMLENGNPTKSEMLNALLDNFEISQLVDTNDEWIQSRTGIKSRHIAREETAVSMAAKAAKRALEDAQVAAAEIDLLIVSSVSSEQLLPCTACSVQKEIGAVNAAAFDLNAACSGFIVAYQMAAGQIKAGLSKKALLIGVECLSNIVNWEDRGTCILFGDGAGAAVVSADEDGNIDGRGNIEIPSVLHSDGSRGEVLTCQNPTGKRADGSLKGYVAMDGREIYKFAARQVPVVVKEILEKAGKSVEEVDLFVLHQANRRIVEAIAKRLKQPIEKFPMDMMQNGNMSSASIPVLLDELKKAGKLQPGMKIVVAGFGAGLTWGGMYLEW